MTWVLFPPTMRDRLLPTYQRFAWAEISFQPSNSSSLIKRSFNSNLYILSLASCSITYIHKHNPVRFILQLLLSTNLEIKLPTDNIIIIITIPKLGRNKTSSRKNMTVARIIISYLNKILPYLAASFDPRKYFHRNRFSLCKFDRAIQKI